MKPKLLLWITVFLIQLVPVLAQTGLFTAEGAGNFALTGIIIVVIIIVFKELAKRAFKKK